MATTNAQTFTIGGVTHQVEDTTARAGVASLQTALASLQSALDTLMGTDDITDEIDTYNEIKDFLDGFDVDDPNLSEQLTTLFTNVNDLVAAMPNKASVTQVNNLQTAVNNLQTALAGKVDAVNGKGLSTNDYTDAEKTKLAGIAEGAQVNVINGIKAHDGQSLTPVNGVVTLPESGGGDVTGVKVNSSTTVEPDANGVVDISEAMAGKQDALNSNTTLATLNGTALHYGDSVTIQGKQGPKGNQGNSGVASADGIESVNNLNGGTTDTAERVHVLGANMGKELNDRLYSLEGVLAYSRDPENDFDDMSINNFTGNKVQDSGYSVSRKIWVEGGQKIKVHITGSKSPVIAQSATSGADNYNGTSYGSVAYVSGQTDYEYTAPAGGKWVSIVYTTADGFIATIDTGSQIEKNKSSIEDILESIGGDEIPFDVAKYYTYANGTFTENNGNVTQKCCTQKLTIADYSRILYTGGSNIFNGYFCAVFFDSNDNAIAFGLNNKDYNGVTTIAGDAVYTLADALYSVPAGAVKVLFQASKDVFTNVRVIAFPKTTGTIKADKYLVQDTLGIKGDGVTDDTTALQALFNSAYGEIDLKPAKYLISSPLLLNTWRVRKLKGNGATLILNGDINGITFKGNFSIGSADPNKTPVQMQSAGVIIEDLRITSVGGLAWHANQTGNNVGTGTGIVVEDVFMPILRGCEIFSVSNGIKFTGTKLRNAIVEGCHIYNCWNNGILFDSGVNLHQVNISHNHISYCKYCININEPQQIANFQITGNDIEVSNYPYGVTESEMRCIRIKGSSLSQVLYEMEIVGNTIQGHGTNTNLVEIAGYSSSFQVTDISFVGNHVSNATIAVSISNVTSFAASGNNIRNCSQAAYKLSENVNNLSVSGDVFAGDSSTYLVNTDSGAALSKVSVNGCVSGGAKITINGASQDYISVVGNCLGGGTVTIGDATHKQEANNI